MEPHKLGNCAQHAIKWCPISKKMVPNVVFTSLIVGYLCISFLSLQFICHFHSQSFQNV